LEGNLVIVDHGMGLNSAFLHLGTVSVREGQAVRQGQLIGTVGATGRATGPHLHWSMKWRDARIDPQELAGPMMDR
jgi:murein DD-endopeptidase MepM/ murein hydrolase activator NlpD